MLSITFVFQLLPYALFFVNLNLKLVSQILRKRNIIDRIQILKE